MSRITNRNGQNSERWPVNGVTEVSERLVDFSLRSIRYVLTVASAIRQSGDTCRAVRGGGWNGVFAIRRIKRFALNGQWRHRTQHTAIVVGDGPNDAKAPYGRARSREQLAKPKGDIADCPSSVCARSRDVSYPCHEDVMTGGHVAVLGEPFDDRVQGKAQAAPGHKNRNHGGRPQARAAHTRRYAFDCGRRFRVGP